MTESTRTLVLMLAVSPLLLAGCGSDNQMRTAPVSGTVTWDGQPVTGGELQFAPQDSGSGTPGKPGSAAVREDGSFVVSTYGEGDGAVVGTHVLTYVAPPPRPERECVSQSSGEPCDPGPAIPSPYEGLVPEEAVVTVSAKGEKLMVKLVK